jgi:Protein of unknown function (DUF2809)
MYLTKKQYLIGAIIIFLVEVYIGLYVHDTIIRPYIGDLLVVILLYCLLKGLVNIGFVKASIYVLLFSYCIEFLQYFKIIEILHLHHIKLARILIGTSFSWIDILCYTIGIFIVLLIEKILQTPNN